MMLRSAALAASLLLAEAAAFGQYKMEPAGAPPADLPPALVALLQKDGYRVVGPSGPFCEVWFRTSLPVGEKSAEDAVAFPTLQQGAVLGVLRFPGDGADRRGQRIKAGVYTLRYAIYPVNGDHQGVAPQRDFAVLTPVAEDKDPNAVPAFERLMTMSRKASGTPHPAVLSLEPPPAGAAPGSLVQEGERDWTLSVKVGDKPIAIILVGKTDA